MLLLLTGDPPPTPPVVLGAPDPAISTRDDVELTLYNTDWTLVGRIDQFDGFELEELDDGTKFLRFTVPLEDLIDLEVYDDIENRPITCHIRGDEVFSGIVMVCDDEDRDGGGSTPDDIVADAKIEAWVDWLALGSRRKVMGTGGDRYSRTNEEPQDAIAAMGEANVDGSIEPTAYASLGTSGVERENFGPYEVTFTGSGTHHETISQIRWDHGDSLAHSILEGCRRHGLKVTSSWNKTASPPVLTVTIGTPRAGTDRTDSVKFDRETGTLVKFGRKVELGKEANVAEVQGAGVRENQIRGYGINQASYDKYGLIEVGDLWASADQADADEEASFAVAQVGGAATTHTAVIQESADLVWNTQYFTGDLVTVSDSRRGLTISAYIAKTKVTLPGALKVEHEIGRVEPSDGSRGQRSGGGGRGNKRQGGKPKRKAGEASGVRAFHPDRGTDPVVMGQAEDEIDIKRAIIANGGPQTLPLAWISGHATLKRLLVGVLFKREELTVCPDAWSPVEIDTNDDGVPDMIRYIPLYKAPPGSNCGSTPPPPVA